MREEEVLGSIGGGDDDAVLWGGVTRFGRREWGMGNGEWEVTVCEVVEE